MTLHIFNPEHDIALAANLSNFTAPHAGRQLRNDLGFLPALWAQEGDRVLVQHEESALKAYRRVCHRLVKLGVSLITNYEFQIPKFTTHSSEIVIRNSELTSIQPWGWDRAIRRELERMGMTASLLPTAEQIEQIRQLSHRRTSAQLLPLLQMDGTVGEAFECTAVEEVTELMQRYGRLVLKAPWSSSGRGVRFDENAAWVSNVIARQGSVMVEPYYNKVKDFGMEFESTDQGIRYVGLSLFHTRNGAYTGNILATEQAKRERMGRYVSLDLLDTVSQQVAQQLDLGDYRGPFGIDMMVVRGDDGFLLHPCVEINLRRTMGHVALSLSPDDDEILRVMQISYDNRYKLSVRQML